MTESMVKVLVDDIFKSKAQTLVNTVNCVGVMGKGIALEFKKRFSEMYDDYVQRCKAKEVKLGQPYLFRSVVPPWILNFPTKDHWRDVARLEDIVKGLRYLEQHYREWGITSLAVPPLGCGQGQLEWKVVGRTLYRHLKRLSIPVELYAPYGTPWKELQPTFLDKVSEETSMASISHVGNRIEPAWVALVDILDRIQKEPYHWPIGRTSFQKIAYFATESGIPTKLEYTRSSFGPYASNLKSIISRLVNNALIREEHLGRMFAVKVGPTFDDAKTSYREDIENWREIMEKVADLFMRIRTTTQAELAATVHFAAKTLLQKNKDKPAEKEVLYEVLKWKQKRRPVFDKPEVALTIRNLSALGWLDVKPSKDLPLSKEALLEA